MKLYDWLFPKKTEPNPTPVLKHEHLIVRAIVKKPPTNTVDLDRWLRDLIVTIDMKLMMGPFLFYNNNPGNRGLTALAGIETSSITMHVWDEPDPGIMQFDVYSCSFVDINKVFAALQEFKPVSIEYTFIDRDEDFNLIDGGKIEYGDEA